MSDTEPTTDDQPAAPMREPLSFWGHAWATAIGIALSIPILIVGAIAALALLADPSSDSNPFNSSSTPDPVIVDHYWSDDEETYYVVLSGVEDANYCEVHMEHNGRRTGDWGNELWTGRRSQVTVAVYPVLHESDLLRVECE